MYVDRMRHQGLKLVERKFPIYSGWTDELLRQRQTREVPEGKFDSGQIIMPLNESFSQESESIKTPSPQEVS